MPSGAHGYGQTWLRAYELRTKHRQAEIARANASEFQKPQASSPRPIDRKDADDDAQGHRSAQEAVGGRFSVRVVVSLSDNRTRDLDGILATVMDCLIAARRRLMEICPEDRN